MERYPEDTEITLEDFRKSGWSEAIEEIKRDNYSSLYHEFSAHAEQVIKEGRLPEGKVLWLLADACSMMLKPNSSNEPFELILAMADDRRSALPEDFCSRLVIFIDF